MKRFSAFAVALVCVLTVGLVATGSAQTWTTLTNAPPVSVGAMLLLTDGRVLVHEEPNCSGSGCVGSDYTAWYTLTPDSTGSYVNGTWTKVASLPSTYAPLFFASAVLPDGKVVVQGGEYNCPSGNCTGDWQSNGALYDPAANTWTATTPPVPSSDQIFGDAQSVVLPNGTWMVAACCAKFQGYTSYADYFYFNESTLNFTTEASASDGETTEFDESGWNLMPNGNVLMVNVYLGAYSATAMGYAIYNPGTNSWSEYASTGVQLWDDGCGNSSKASYELGPVMLLPSGTMFATGASECEAGKIATYNPTTNTWTSQGTFPGKSAANDAPGATEINGNAIVITSPYTNTFSTPLTTYEWNGSALSTIPSPSRASSDSSYVTHLLVLPNGQILFTDFSTTVQVLTSAGTYQSAWQPTITTAPTTLAPGTTYSISGTQFNGLSTGASYGDDFQDNTNYPLVRIVSNATGKVYYAKTHGHSTMGVATGSTLVSTNFDVPATMPTGGCELYVVANGIPSAAWACSVGSTQTSTTAVASSLNPSVYGQSINLFATVSGSGATPTGTVQFNIDGSAFGSPVTLSSGTATITGISTLAVGTHTVTASYSGDSNFSSSTGTLSGGQVVNAATTSTAVTSNLNPSAYGQSVTFTATISGQYGLVKGRVRGQAVSGTVAWSNNTGCGMTTVTSGNSGAATCTTSVLAAGSDTVTAIYSGDSNHSGSTGSFSETVNQAATTTTVASSLNPSAYGQSVSFSAVVSSSGGTPAGTVQFNIDGNAFGSPVTLASGTATSGSSSTLTQGTHTVTAVYSGNTSFGGSTGTLSGGQVVSSATTSTVVTSNLNPSVFGQSVTLTATISGQYGLVKGRVKSQAVSGTVAWSANTGCGTTSVTSGNPGTATCTTSSLPVGSDTVTGTYSGDGNHGGSAGSFSETVSQVATTTTVASSLNPSVYGQSVSFTAVVSGSPGTPSGTVQFYIDSSAFGSPVTLSSGSASSGSVSTMTEGTHTITAVYSGNTNFGGSTGTLNGQVVNSATASTVVTSNLNPSAFGQTVTFTATISGQNGLVKGRVKSQNVTGTVSWTANTGCGTTTVTSGNPGTATCITSSLAVGSDTVTATYSGDSNHSGSSGSFSQTVNTAASTTLVGSSLNPSAYGQSTSFSAVVSASGGTPTGTVQFNVDGSAFGSPVTLSSGSATSGSISTLTQGTHTVTAVYSGNSNFGSSTGTLSGGQVVNSATAGTVVTSNVNPSAFGQSVTFTATISGEYGLLKGRPKSQNVTGTVSWSTNTGCGTTTVTSGNPGTATCSTSSLSVGSDSITATYSGDSNHSGSTGNFSQTVNQATTTLSVTSVSPAAEDYGADTPVTITAVLSWTGTGTAPSASAITIGGNGPSSYGATNCGSASGNTITCTNAYTPGGADLPGTYTESATFAGDTNYSSSSSTQSNNFAINQATSSTSVSSGLNPSAYGQSVTFTATISGENGLVKGGVGKRGAKKPDVTGTVNWSTNTGCGTTSVVSGNPGTATCTTTTLPTGSDTVTANYSGDNNHGASSGNIGQTVNQASQTITFTTNAPSSATYNTGFSVAATGGASGNPVTFTSSGMCSNSGPNYTMTSGTGTCSVIANQAGNSNYAAATPVTENVSATKASQTITFTTNAPASANNGSSFTVAASASSGLAVAYSSSGVCTNTGATYTMTSGTGTCSVITNQAGDNNYAAASPLVESVTATSNLQSQTITFTVPAPATAKSGDSFMVAATGGGSGNPVTFTVGAGSVCTLAGATYTMTSSTGYCYVVANQAGNSQYSPAPQITVTVMAVKTVVKVAPTVTFTGAPQSAAYLSTFTVATTQNSGIIPTITSTTGSVCSVSNGIVTMKEGTGTCTVKASWKTNDYYLAATLEQSTTATLLGTTTTITNTVPESNPLKVTVYFAVSNGTSTAAVGTVKVTAASGQACSGSVAAGKCVLSFTAPESTLLTANYQGNTNNAASTSASYPLTVQ
jgi:large repetitive protein